MPQEITQPQPGELFLYGVTSLTCSTGVPGLCASRKTMWCEPPFSMTLFRLSTLDSDVSCFSFRSPPSTLFSGPLLPWDVGLFATVGLWPPTIDSFVVRRTACAADDGLNG
eukprot:CAMPEP_0176249482 /NCGR_PEP_ID=MMETSP0121_2-20121125/33999_1 /TAXON_ID=160619 /ORGANISM="Kryptoperidinium foliaceum, Strain CCMP 1326" /LENGTH=110 /DNA_ID=CAMNT_0017589181 /DNA_START=116 /DNA_END=445 /DNA_ORIENTATION=+